MTLADLAKGDKAIIVKVRGRGAFRKRIMEMGFVAGKEVTVIQRAPLMDPVE
ncbi:MAG: FeoA family protein, partial [Lentimicrobiaceae bacterium]